MGSDHDKAMLEDFAFAVVALRLRPDDFWNMSRGEFIACVKMWRRINGHSSEEKSQEQVDSLSKFISGTFGGESSTNKNNG